MATKKKIGRPKIEINYDLLREACEILCTGEECASLLGIDYDTMNRCLKRDGNKGFTDYYKKNSVQGRKSLRRKQFDIAVNGDGNVAMLIWLGKQFLGQAEPVSNEQQTQQKQAIADKQLSQFERLVKLRDSGLFTDQQLQAMADLVNE